MSLDELFNRDPELLTEPELEVIVAALRKDRERFSAEPVPKPKLAPGAKAPAKAKKVAAPNNLSLDDLGL